MSGSAKAGTIAERHTCELRVLPKFAVRAPPKRASGGIFFSLTKTYMEVGKPVATDLLVKAPLSWLSVVTDFRPLKCMTKVLSRPKCRLPGPNLSRAGHR
jgi:hypothetical protein